METGTWKLKGGLRDDYKLKVQTRLSWSEEMTWEDRPKSDMIDAAKKVCGMTRGQE